MDIHGATYLSRLEIGCGHLVDKWAEAEANFTDNNLKICGHPVMERWETGYMKKLARLVTIGGGTILEVGFGLGIAASFIQQAQIERHIIIEANKQVFARVRLFASRSVIEVKSILGFWQERIEEIKTGSISGILFDTYPLFEQEIHCNHFSFFKHAFRVLKTGGVFTYYSDEENWFSKQHLFYLRQAGFSKIGGQVCQVKPPIDCQYWRSSTILAPLIIK